MNPNYPIYVISKGRSQRLLTYRELRLMNVPHRIVIEPEEEKDYAKYVEKKDLLILPFQNLGIGSTPARNWVWEHSISEGHKKHWILDDNIEGFHRLNKNKKHKVESGTIFKCAEDFSDRYENVGLSGFNYYSFCKATDSIPAYYLNTRIYSCILVDNSLPFRWRGKYNEDTDLSLRVLKNGMCTILFNAFLCGKVTTMRMRGGNTDNVYNDGTNRRAFAEALKKLHPDCVDVVWRFNRWHHNVDYSKFRKNKLVKKKGIEINEGINNYGMTIGTR